MHVKKASANVKLPQIKNNKQVKDVCEKEMMMMTIRRQSFKIVLLTLEHKAHLQKNKLSIHCQAK